MPHKVGFFKNQSWSQIHAAEFPMTPVTRQELWRFVRERYAIHWQRTQGIPPPWTDDVVLRAYRFTNIFREDDKTTIALKNAFRNDTTYSRIGSGGMLFNVAAARWFGIPSTWRLMRLPLLRWDYFDMMKQLDQAQRVDHIPIFTSAYAIGSQGTDNILGWLNELWSERARVASVIIEDGTLEAAVKTLRCMNGIGPFLAYEIVQDLRHTPLLRNAPDIMTWGSIGPGSRRGAARLGATDDDTAHDVMLSLLADQRKKKYKLNTLPQLDMRAAEDILCEGDKYFRIVFGEAMGKRRYPGGNVDTVKNLQAINRPEALRRQQHGL